MTVGSDGEVGCLLIQSVPGGLDALPSHIPASRFRKNNCPDPAVRVEAERQSYATRCEGHGPDTGGHLLVLSGRIVDQISSIISQKN